MMTQCMKTINDGEVNNFLKNPDVKEALHRYDDECYSDSVKIVRKNIRNIMEYFLFELNDKKTRKTLQRIIRSHLETLSYENIIEDFTVEDKSDENELFIKVSVLPVNSEKEEVLPFRVKNVGV